MTVAHQTPPSALPLAGDLDHLGRHITGSAPSAEVRSLAREGVRDFVAVSLPVTYGHFHDEGIAAVLELFGSGDPGHIAVRLGYRGHALDFDDYHAGMRGHPTTVVLPALFAAHALLRDAGKGHESRHTIDDFLDAYVIGVELAGRVGLALGTRHYVAGFHATATVGAIAAAGAVARLIGLSSAATDNALGLAATQAAGLRGQFGSSAKPLHAGVAARIGYEAAFLADRGFQGRPGVLGDFLTTLGLGAAAPERLTQGWGAPWRIASPGLEFKRYSTCGGTHGAADAALGLRRALFDALAIDATGLQDSPSHAADLAQRFESGIDGIVIAFPPGADVAPNVVRPRNQVEARFSLEYVIATALVDGDLSLARFADGAVDDTIARLATKIERRPDPTVPPDADNPDARFHELTLRLKNGRTLSRRVTRSEVVKTPGDANGKLAQSLRLLGGRVNVERVLADTSLNRNEHIGNLLDLLDPMV